MKTIKMLYSQYAVEQIIDQEGTTTNNLLELFEGSIPEIEAKIADLNLTNRFVLSCYQ